MEIEKIEEIKEMDKDNYLILFVSSTMIHNKKGEECSFVEYICKDKYPYYCIKNDKKKNYAIIFEKDKINKSDLLNICSLIEYRESLFSFSDVDMFEIVKDMDNVLWKKYVDVLNKEVTRLQENSVMFGDEGYDKWNNELSLMVFVKYVFTEGMGVEKNYDPSNEFSYIFNEKDSSLSEKILSKYIMPIVCAEADVRLFLSDKAPYKLIKNELLRFGKNDYKDYLKEIKDLRNNFYTDNDIYVVKYVSEWELYKLVKENYSDTLYQYSPPFLNRQRYDIYIPSFRLAIEYQGQQHYEEIDFFGPLSEIQERDKRKKELSDENNVNILYWKYDEKINQKNLEEKIKEYL